MAFVRNGLTGTYYVNGTRIGQKTALKSVVYNNWDLYIGADYRDQDNYFEGKMDHINIYSVGLTDRQINILYTGYLTQW